jgi:hypothetical protein
MPGPRDSEEEKTERSFDTGRLLLVAVVVLAVASTGVLILTDSAQWLRLGVLAGLWSALLGVFLAARYRKQVVDRENDAADLQSVYELELEREVAARREFELEIEAETRRRLQEEQAESMTALRNELHNLKDALDRLTGGEVLVERIALRAQSTRMRAIGEPSGRINDPRRLPPGSHSPEPSRQIKIGDTIDAGSSPSLLDSPVGQTTDMFAPPPGRQPAPPQQRRGPGPYRPEPARPVPQRGEPIRPGREPMSTHTPPPANRPAPATYDRTGAAAGRPDDPAGSRRYDDAAGRRAAEPPPTRYADPHAQEDRRYADPATARAAEQSPPGRRYADPPPTQYANPVGPQEHGEPSLIRRYAEQSSTRYPPPAQPREPDPPVRRQPEPTGPRAHEEPSRRHAEPMRAPEQSRRYTESPSMRYADPMQAEPGRRRAEPAATRYADPVDLPTYDEPPTAGRRYVDDPVVDQPLGRSGPAEPPRDREPRATAHQAESRRGQPPRPEAPRSEQVRAQAPRVDSQAQHSGPAQHREPQADPRRPAAGQPRQQQPPQQQRPTRPPVEPERPRHRSGETHPPLRAVSPPQSLPQQQPPQQQPAGSGGGRRRAEDRPEPAERPAMASWSAGLEDTGAHTAGRSVTELLAAHANEQEQSRRRRRRSE